MTLETVKKKILYFLEGIWLPIHANLSGIHHLLRGHKVRWFEDADLWNAHLGWIWCHNCKDTEKDDNNQHNDLVIGGFFISIELTSYCRCFADF